MNSYPSYLVKQFGNGVSIKTPKVLNKHALLSDKEAKALKFKLTFPVAMTDMPRKAISCLDEVYDCYVCGKPTTFLANNTPFCDVCWNHELVINQQIAEMKLLRSAKDNRVTELANQLLKELPVNDREYHVKEITSIVVIEEQLNELGMLTNEQRRYELAKIVEQRIQTLQERFFAIRKEEDEIKSAMVADQKYLNILVPKLREEERAQFKNYDISYKPTTVSVPKATAKAPRLSASDKAMESGARLMGLTLEQYKKVMADAIKSVMNVECTCQSMPGMCKVHP